MGKSFFRGTDAHVHTGSRAFSAKINESPEAFGISPELAAEYALVDAVYAEAYLTSQNPKERTRGAVIAKNDAKARLKLMASNLAKLVDGSGVSDAQKIILGLSVRAKPAPLPPPGRPDRFVMALRGDGSLELTWTCKNPPGSRGTMYRVSRRVGSNDAVPFEYLGMVGKRRFVDSTLPAGTAQVMYRVQGVRLSTVGDVALFGVSLGVMPGSGLPATSMAPSVAA